MCKFGNSGSTKVKMGEREGHNTNKLAQRVTLIIMLKRAYRNTISAFQSRSNDRSQRRETDPSNEYKESGQQEDDYKQPLELDKALYRYHKERHTPLATSTTLEQQQQSHQLFLPLLPYELLVQIFKKLELNDLFCCAVVSKSWCDFMANWPTFWQILSCELPHINKNNLNALLRREAKEFKLDGPISTISPLPAIV
ncbi:hypothetical protein BDA99DRAFT_544034 [Phascolomyces articulosus]|uniref:F-box domain-containing protein n=1 Tax=Phascolomyces articulosus TaxID=60185 RepID=A0AAD5P742_9FUNG|nr:hypothetical protein BDA99DRAFT_544034 [Phascolomyces articulosus]